MEAATWSARRDASPGYGIAVFDVNPGARRAAQTSITVRYYHAARPCGSPDPVSPVAGEPAGDYALFETFTLVRPRSDGRRWHPREPVASRPRCDARPRPARRPGPGTVGRHG